MNETRAAALLRAAADQPTSAQVADDIAGWIQQATAERVVPLLWTLMAVDGEATTDNRLAVHQAQVDAMSLAVRIERELLRVAAELVRAEVPFAVLKGCATAHLDYRDPALRQLGDVDVLVAPEDFGRAIELLSNERRAKAYALPRDHVRFTHAVTMRTDERVELDLHQKLGHRALGATICTEVLLRRAESFEIAGTELWALDREDRLIHAAMHAVTSRGSYRRLSGFADILVLSGRPETCPDVVLERCERWRVTKIVAEGLEQAHAIAGLAPDPRWSVLTEQGRSRRPSLVERAYRSDRRRPALEEIAFLRLMSSWKDRFDYVRGYLATDEDYRRHRGRSGFGEQSRYLLKRLRDTSR